MQVAVEEGNIAREETVLTRVIKRNHYEVRDEWSGVVAVVAVL